jgi:uncharacterized membrane protein YbhN (UPF0104 family)
VAFLIQLSWFGVVGLTFRELYLLLGAHETMYKLALMSAAANFVNIVAPSAGMGGMAVFIRGVGRRGSSAGKATVASMLYIFLDYIAFLFVLTLGLIVLFRRNDLAPAQLAASAIILATAVGLGFLLYIGSRSAEALGNTLARMARLVNRIVKPFIHRDYLSESRAHEFALDMETDLKSIPGKVNSLGVPLLYAFANKSLLMGIL